MRKRIIKFLVFAFFAVGISVGTSKDKQLYALQLGTVVIKTQPSGAKVYWSQRAHSDWKSASKVTPCTIQLGKGKRYIRLDHNGNSWVFAATIKSGVTISLIRNLSDHAPYVYPNSPLAIARAVFAKSKNANLSTKDFIPGAKDLITRSGKYKESFTETNSFKLPRKTYLSASTTKAELGDVIVLTAPNDYKRLLVYAGEHAFTKGGKKRSFFYYPIFKNAGIELNTFPPRYHHRLLEVYGILEKSTAKENRKLAKAGKSHVEAVWDSARIDGQTIRFLKSPRINERLYYIPKPSSFAGTVYRAKPQKYTLTINRFFAQDKKKNLPVHLSGRDDDDRLNNYITYLRKNKKTRALGILSEEKKAALKKEQNEILNGWQGGTLSSFKLTNGSGKVLTSGYMLEAASPPSKIQGSDRAIMLGTYQLMVNPGKKGKFRLVVDSKAKAEKQFGNRDEINIHIGNAPSDIEGCFAPGNSFIKQKSHSVREYPWVSSSGRVSGGYTKLKNELEKIRLAKKTVYDGENTYYQAKVYKNLTIVITENPKVEK